MDETHEIVGKVKEEREEVHEQDMRDEGAEVPIDTAAGGSTLNSDQEKEEERIKRKEDWLMVLSNARIAFEDAALRAAEFGKLLETMPLYWEIFDESTSSGNEAVHREENSRIRECPECLKRGKKINIRHIRRECPYGGINVPFDPISLRKAPKLCWNCGGDHLVRFCNLNKR